MFTCVSVFKGLVFAAGPYHLLIISRQRRSQFARNVIVHLCVCMAVVTGGHRGHYRWASTPAVIITIIASDKQRSFYASPQSLHLLPPFYHMSERETILKSLSSVMLLSVFIPDISCGG